MQKKFILYCLLFFTPVVAGYFITEWCTLRIPSVFNVNEKYIEKKQDSFEVLVLGSSQMMSGVNAEWMQPPTLNLASGNQHHDTDFKLLKGMLPKLPRLKTVVLEVSYSHFELPHNGKDFWKNSLYLKYYHINCFERKTYFKDELIYLSNPSFFSKSLKDFYIEKKHLPHYNAYAFNDHDGYGQFEAKGYNKKTIDAMHQFKINTQPNLRLFQKNTALFFEMLDVLMKENKNVVLCTLPMYETYLPKRNPEILKRRDSILREIEKKYPSVKFLLAENDTLHYHLKDYWNQSHLSPSGAKKFTATLDSVVRSFR